VEDADYGAAARFRTNRERREARAEIVARIQLLLRQRPRGQWLDLFARHRIPAGPINRLDEVAVDRELHARGMLYSIPAFDTFVPQVGLGIGVDGSSQTFRSAPPRLGEHTRAVLREELGLGETELGEMREQHIIYFP
ncbi:MAG: CoA transferase, partial [Pseudomonadota bacterium]